MRKLIICLLIIFLIGFFRTDFVKCSSNKVFALNSSSEDAQLFFEEALALKRKGEVEEGAKMYLKAIRTNRSVLASDDHGLIDDLKKYCLKKLEESPEDLKTLDTLGFLYAVCYSDSNKAVEYYQKVADLTKSEKVKEKTQWLIQRLKAIAEAEEKAQQDIAEKARDEKLKSWAEMEKADRLGEQSAKSKEFSNELSNAYKAKDSLKNRVPQLEKELKDLKAEYDKQNRLWHTLNDELYHRRRRRLRDIQIPAKEKELEEAKRELQKAVDRVEEMEKEDQQRKSSLEASPIRSYDEDNSTSDTGENSSTSTPPQQPSANDYGSPPPQQPDVNNAEPLKSDNPEASGASSEEGAPEASSNSEQEPLPGIESENPDETASDTVSSDKAPSKDEKLDDLINSL